MEHHDLPDDLPTGHQGAPDSTTRSPASPVTAAPGDGVAPEGETVLRRGDRHRECERPRQHQEDGNTRGWTRRRTGTRAESYRHGRAIHDRLGRRPSRASRYGVAGERPSVLRRGPRVVRILVRRSPRPAQAQGWAAIAGGDHTLILAPTGSGKTLAAFLWAIDRLSTDPPPEPARRTRVLYISPLRALAVDVEKNLRSPLTGIQHAAAREGTTLAHEPTVGVRTGDTPARDRRRLIAHPPDILITTPESLYLMLTSSARETLRERRPP